MPLLPWSTLGPLTFLDVETTGSRDQLYVIELAALRWENGREVDRLVTLVDPEIHHIENTWIHGITRRDLDGAPTWPALLPALRRVLEGTTLVAHSASVETRAMNTTLGRAGGSWNGPRLCTLKLARLAHADRSGKGAHKLGNLVDLHGLQMPGRAHEAYADTAVLPDLVEAFLALAEDDKTRATWLRKAHHKGAGVRWPTAAGPDPRRLKSRA
jgi:DNA polymerase-3 subunit epsilon